MATKFTEEQLDAFLKINIASGKLKRLYKHNHIQKREIVLDNSRKTTNRKQDDFISEWLIKQNINLLFENNIEQIKREISYKSQEHLGDKHNKTKSFIDLVDNEVLFARRLFNENLDFLGEIIDYQTPIKKTKLIENIGVGDVDLISYNDKNKTLYLIEIKRLKSDETMLRAILEICTYFYQIDKAKLKKDFDYSNSTNIKKAVLVFKNSPLYIKYKEAVSNGNYSIVKLAELLEVEIFNLDIIDNKIVIEKDNNSLGYSNA